MHRPVSPPTSHRRPPTRRAGRVWTVLVLTLTLLASAACSSSSDTSAQPTLRDIVTRAIQRARAAREGGSGTTTSQPAPSSSIGTDGRSTFDYTAYQRTLSGTLSLLEQFWRATLPRLGGTYRPLSGYTYYRSDQGGGPRCGGEPAPAKNAFYCPAGDFIAWDESGLMIPYYVQGGDFAASFVLAHEFGHAMQARLPRKEQAGVLRELQADCFAGAWARWVSDRGLLDAGDLDEATLAVFIARDVPGTPWTDPQAHGSGFQRTRAFGDGFEASVKDCYPAPADRWILTSQ
jgi:predicted metalloprotease